MLWNSRHWLWKVIWNEPALKAAFRQGLNPDLLTELACRNDQVSLESLIEMTICFDYLIWRHQLHQREGPTSLEPIQESYAKLTAAEWERRKKEHLCFTWVIQIIR